MGLKLYEIVASKGVGIIAYLLRKSDEGGGGDIEGEKECPNAGRWAGDRIVIIGDYDSSKLYNEVMHESEQPRMNEEMPYMPYKDISLIVRKEYEKFLGEPLGKRWDK